MTGGSLPAQTWHDIMVAAHQGVEVREIPGIGMGQKLPTEPMAAQADASDRRCWRPSPRPPPVLTKRGADVLVRVEKLLDERRQDRDRTAVRSPDDAQATPAAARRLAASTSASRATPSRRTMRKMYDANA